MATSASVTTGRWAAGCTLDVDWQAADRWTLAARLSNKRNRDPMDDASGQNLGERLQSRWRFALPGPGRPLPARAFLRVPRRVERSDNRVFGLCIDWVDIGLAMRFF